VVHLRYQVPTQVVYISDDSGDECNGEDSSDLDPDFETPRKMHNAGGYGVTPMNLNKPIDNLHEGVPTARLHTVIRISGIFLRAMARRKRSVVIARITPSDIQEANDQSTFSKY
ncbi:hypothetical protein MPER_05402, partial [Moniliophthora perniciosa FA553]